MSVLKIDGLAIHFEVHGSGPAIVIPRCNFAWNDLDLRLFTDSYSVVVVSPRGFGESGRAADGYEPDTIRTDIEAVLDHLGIAQFLAFGYSMTGSVAPWLGHGNPRVRAVISGGFPAACSYQRLLPYIRTNLADAQQDPVRSTAMWRTYDPDALLAWYSHVDTYAPGALVDRLECPIFCFWGAADEIIEHLAGLETLASETASRDIPFAVHSGYHHQGMLRGIDVAVSNVLPWLREVWPST